MTVSIVPSLCMGCGLCAEMCTEVFLMDGEIAIVGASPFSLQSKSDCRNVKALCL
jgi:ferredoxin